MANNLTGDYEAVVQIAVRQINGLLATLHQNGAAGDAPLKLLHSTSLRVGDRRPRPPDLDVFGDWVRQYQMAGSGQGMDDLRTQLTGMAPPGAARRLADAFVRSDQRSVPQDPPDVVRGRVKLQLSSVTISVPDGSTSEVTVHAHVRAQYYPDPGTTDMPAPVHGEVQAVFEVRKGQSASGRRLLVQPSAQDSKIQFMAAPGSGLSAVDVSRIAAQVRKVVREGITLLPVDLPPDFPFADFKGLGSGTGQAVALPLRLSGPGLPAGSIQSVTQSFIGSTGFAFAVSKEFVESRIKLEAIRGALDGRRIVFRLGRFGVTVSVTYRLRFSAGPSLAFKSGAIEISGRVEAETGTWWAPNGFVSFKQGITVRLDVPSQNVSLEPVGEPDVDESWFIPHDRAVSIVKSEMDNALASNASPVRRVFDDAKKALGKGLKTFDGAASATYTAIEITPDGVIVRGEIGSASRRATVVDIAETHQRGAFSAFQSWIPAGRIERFIWSWVEYQGLLPSIWSGVARSFTDEQSFIFPKPPGITELSHICLRVEGTQTLPDGQAVSITAGTTCQVPEPEFAIDVPSWWEPVTVPIWWPDLTDRGAVREAIAGHVSVQTDLPRKGELRQNSLVYFADWRSDKPFAALADALSRRRRQRVALAVFVVLPAGAFDSRRQELELKLASVRERVPVPLQVTEDDEGGWTRTFAVAKTPSVYLVNARREFVWKYEGEPDPDVLAAALDEHLVAAPAPRFRSLRLAVSPGERAPDVFFQDDGGDHSALHRLRGREVLLNFWQSWSAPCLKELRRLQGLDERGREAPFIVAFHGGKEGKALDEIRKRLGLSFALVQDSEQRVARRYGVRCWPTTITVNAEGRVEHVQFGLSPEHKHTPGRQAPDTA